MRRTRRLILILIVLILGGAGYTYYIQKTTQARNAPNKPAALPEAVSSRANDWIHVREANGVPIYEVKAKGYRMDRERESRGTRRCHASHVQQGREKLRRGQKRES